MNTRATRPPTPSLHVERLHLVTDRAIAAEHEQALATQIVGALDAALADAGMRADVRIGELVVQAGGDSLRDRAAMSQLAASVARRILDRGSD